MMTSFHPERFPGEATVSGARPRLAGQREVDYSAAVAFYDATLQTQPDRYAWTGRGFALLKLGRYEEALASYDKALEIRSDETSWCNRGHALYYLERYEEALSSYDRALESDPDFDAAFYGKARTYALQNQVALALEQLQQAIALSPDEYRQIASIDPAFQQLQTHTQFHRMIRTG